MRAGDIVERVGRDVVRLTLSHKRVVLEQILLLGAANLGLRVENFLRLLPG